MSQLCNAWLNHMKNRLIKQKSREDFEFTFQSQYIYIYIRKIVIFTMYCPNSSDPFHIKFYKSFSPNYTRGDTQKNNAFINQIFNMANESLHFLYLLLLIQFYNTSHKSQTTQKRDRHFPQFRGRLKSSVWESWNLILNY